MPNQLPLRNSRGLTLIELMVVLVIIGILVGVSVPLIRPHLQDKSMREAARELNGFLAMAKARAAENGRPAGIWIERSGGTEQAASTAFVLHLVETPPPYAGDVSNARAEVRNVNTGTAQVRFTDSLSASLPSLVQIGDRIRFDFRGGWYNITSAPVITGTNISFDISTPSGANFPMPSVTGQHPYQVLRSPQRAFGRSLELPKNSCIDLAASGVGLNEFHGGVAGSVDPTPVAIIFDPTGRISTYYVGNAPNSPAGTINLLIGRPDRVTPGDPVGPDSNLVEEGAKWVTVNHATGLVSTADIVDVSTTANNVATRLNQSRSLARNSQISGGG